MSKTGEWVTLQRDCDALLIPSAMPVMIPSGTNVRITQQMGGTATIQVNGQLLRIEAKDLSALGLEVQAQPISVKKTNIPKEANGPVEVDAVWEQLKSCYDPEIPVNIVDLGLIYTCQITPSNGGKSNHVLIEMTLTAPGCGMGPVLASDIETRVREVENVTDVTVELVFEPVWTQDRMSEAARLELVLM